MYEYQLDADAISKLLKQLDDDIAQRVVMAAVSMDPQKLAEAIKTGAQEQDLRTQEKRKKALEEARKHQETMGITGGSVGTEKASQDLIDNIKATLGPLFSPSGSKGEDK